MNKSVNNLMCFLILFLFLISSPFPAYADTPAEIGQDPPATDEAIPVSDTGTIDTGQEDGTSMPLQTEVPKDENIVYTDQEIVQYNSPEPISLQLENQTDPIVREQTENRDASLPLEDGNMELSSPKDVSEGITDLMPETVQPTEQNDLKAQLTGESSSDEKQAENARGDPPEETAEPPDSAKSSESEEKTEDEENEETDDQGNLTAEKEGIVLEGGGTFDILVEGTLKSGNVPILVKQDVNPDNVIITVWEIENPVEVNGEKHVVLEEKTDNGAPVATETSNQIEEKKIFYIIKKANSEAKITLSKKEGGALENSHGYEVAKETETVVMKVEVPDGYKLKDAWCDDEKQIRIIPGDDGSYSIEVPRGGGVYLSVELEKDDDDDDDDDDGYVVCIPAVCEPCCCTCTDESFEIVFDLNGGELNGDKGPVRFLKKCGDTMQLLEAPVRPGYRFVRWAVCPGCKCVKVSQPGEEFVVKCDVTFTAVWEAVGSYDFDDDEDDDDDDVTETVVIQPKDGENIEKEINGSVIIEDDPATGIRIEGTESGKSSVELEVDGKISVTGKEHGAVGVSVTAGENSKLKADVEAEDGMTVKSGGKSTGIQAEAKSGAELKVEFEGDADVSSETKDSVGVSVNAASSGSATVEVEGNLKSDGTGAVLHAEDSGHVELRIGEEKDSS